ncbi:MAG: hypothetical protein ACKVTZ_02625 [Bacteroidia bacterium]
MQVNDVALSFTDISDLKNAQLTLDHQNKDLQEIAFIQSHELRGPLALVSNQNEAKPKTIVKKLRA